MTRELSVFHTIAGLQVQSGGTSKAVVDLADALGQQPAIHPVLVSQALLGESTLPSLNPNVQRLIANTNSPNALRLGLPLRGALHNLIKDHEFSLIQNHGLWLPVNHWVSRFARTHRIAMIAQPHGMLEPWAMNHKAWKKRLAWNLYQRRDLESAAVLHATAEQEAESFRQLGLRQPIAIIPNGTDLPEWRDQAYPKGTPRKMLFLSRIHQKKGLLNLIQAWQIVRPSGWKMIIAGPDEGGHQPIVEAAIHQAGLQDDFEFTGSVYGDEKEALYRSAEVFVLPTFSENFGLVVAEALACGVSVITTKGAPWQGLHTHRCGWWIDIGVEPLVAALREAMNLPPDTLREMGQRGRTYVEQNFGWPGIAQQMLSVYRWVLGQGERPDCVHLD
ncbi:MAG: glycosyltransferase [Candidatus Competibacteraceae bacterium]|nr:MAG: glycosyltransferase [Candidatus Competibacteraceae bacterium]